MIKQRLARLFLCTFAVVASLNCAAQFTGPRPVDTSNINVSPQITTDQSILFPPQRDIRIMPGDLISITLYGNTDYKVLDRVSLNGYLDVPLLDPLQIAGLSPHEVERLIETRLKAAQLYNNPQAAVSITESPTQIATVIGEVHGVVPLLISKRLFDVLGAVGGLPATASHFITIHRPGVPQPINVDLGADPAQSHFADIPIFAGDTIVTSRPNPIYVLGAVKAPSMVNPPATTPISLLQTIASVGGPVFEAKTHDMYIVRTIAGKRSVIPVNYARVVSGKSPDPILFGDDIVVVPSSTIRAAIRGGGIGVLLALVSTISYIGLTR